MLIAEIVFDLIFVGFIVVGIVSALHSWLSKRKDQP